MNFLQRKHVLILNTAVSPNKTEHKACNQYMLNFNSATEQMLTWLSF